MHPIKKGLLTVLLISTLSLSGCCSGKPMHVKIKASDNVAMVHAIDQVIMDLINTL